MQKNIKICDWDFKFSALRIQTTFTVNLYWVEKFFPTFFILMKNRLKNSYIMGFKKIQRKCLLSHDILVVDFETGVVSALFCLSKSRVNGWVFHFISLFGAKYKVMAFRPFILIIKYFVECLEAS